MMDQNIFDVRGHKLTPLCGEIPDIQVIAQRGRQLPSDRSLHDGSAMARLLRHVKIPLRIAGGQIEHAKIPIAIAAQNRKRGAAGQRGGFQMRRKEIDKPSARTRLRMAPQILSAGPSAPR